MPVYHLSLKTSSDHKINAHEYYQYICRLGKYSEGEEVKQLIYHASHNMPYWAQKRPYEFWKASFDFELLSVYTFKELEIALPWELSKEEQIKLAEEFCQEVFEKEVVYTLAIHANGARISKIGKFFGSEILSHVEHPHMHIMFCERRLDKIRRSKTRFFKKPHFKNPLWGGTKIDNRWSGTGWRKQLIEVREKWFKIQNKYIQENGIGQRVDNPTLKV